MTHSVPCCPRSVGGREEERRAAALTALERRAAGLQQRNAKLKAWVAKQRRHELLQDQVGGAWDTV